MRKLLPGIILFILLSIIPGETVVKSEPLPEKPIMPWALAEAGPHIKEVYAETVENFALYSSFLGDCTLKGDCLVPVHGSDRQEALNYLNQGFTGDMTDAIIDECTIFNSQLGCLVINPGDGIPVLTGQDQPDIWLVSESENRIVFLRKYKNCYAEGDEYEFLVTMTRDDDSWRISALSFTAINNH